MTDSQAVKAKSEHYRIGRRFLSDACPVDGEQIRAFALQFDPQVFHIDEAAAAESDFGGLIASGWHTAAMTMRLLVGSGAFMAEGAVGAGADIKWLRPVRAGDVLTVVAEVTAIAPSSSRSDRSAVNLRVETNNQRGETVQVMNAKIVVPQHSPVA